MTVLDKAKQIVNGWSFEPGSLHQTKDEMAHDVAVALAEAIGDTKIIYGDRTRPLPRGIIAG